MHNDTSTLMSSTPAFTRRQLLRAGATGAGGLALAGLLAACTSASSTKSASSSSSSAKASVGSLTWALPADTITALDDAVALNLPALTVQSLIFQGLLLLKPDMTVEPGIASAWSQPDSLTYQFTLRPGVKFSDGTALTVDDVVASMNRHLDPKVASELGSYYGNVKSIVASGTDQVIVHLSAPDPTFKYVTVFSHIAPKSLIEKLGTSFGRPSSTASVIGTGAYQVKSFSSSTAAVLEANPYYWGSKPVVQQVSFTCISDPTSRRLAMQSGEIDGSFALPLQDVAAWKKLDGVTLYTSSGLSVGYVSFDVQQAPFDDLHVRRAIGYSMDRAGYVKAFLGGNGTPANSLVPPGEWTGLLSTSERKALYKAIPSYTYSRKKAKSELAQSKYPKGFTTSVKVSNALPELVKSMEALAQELKHIGITLNVSEVDNSTWLAGFYDRGDIGMQVSVSNPSYADPSDYLGSHYVAALNLNTARYSNPTFNEYMSLQASATDPATRAKYQDRKSVV